MSKTKENSVFIFSHVLDQSLFVAHYMVRFFHEIPGLARHWLALGLSVLSRSLKASVAVELELGCMTPAARSSPPPLPSLFCCCRRYKFSERPPALFFLLLSIPFFVVVHAHERSAWMSLCGGVSGADRGCGRWRRPLSARESHVVFRCDLHGGQARSFFLKAFLAAWEDFFFSLFLPPHLHKRIAPKNASRRDARLGVTLLFVGRYVVLHVSSLS